MSLATLSGQTVTRASVQLGITGAWWADVETDSTIELSGAVTLIVSDATYQGTVVSGGTVNGRGRYRVIAGAGRWYIELAAKHYTNDAGIKASQILADCATEAGESIGTVPVLILGTHWTRVQGPAIWTVETLCPAGWHIDASGVLQIGEWPASTYPASPSRVVPYDPATSTLTVATENIALLVPGCTVDGLSVGDVRHDVDAGKLRSRLWCGASTGSRALAAWRKISDTTSPARYLGLTEYRVVSQIGDRLDLQVVRRSSGMPDIRRCPVRTGVSGSKSTLTPGSLVLVAFVDADPARPVVVSFDDPESPGFVPVSTAIDATTVLLGSSTTALQGVARLGDTAGPYVITSASLSVRAK